MVQKSDRWRKTRVGSWNEEVVGLITPNFTFVGFIREGTGLQGRTLPSKKDIDTDNISRTTSNFLLHETQLSIRRIRKKF